MTGHTPFREIKRNPRAEEYRNASKQVAEEQVAFATAFLRFKARAGTSDGQAREQATVETGAALTVALAEQEIARIRLQNS